MCVATVALEQQDRSMLFLLLLLQRLFYACIYVIKRAGLVMVFGKKKEKPLFFLLLLPRSLSIVFDWCDIWRRRSISLLFLLSVGFYLLAKCILNELWFDEERETERTRQDNCVHYWNKWSCYTTSEQNDGRVRRRRRRRRRDEWGNHFLLLLLPSYKK